MKFVSKFESNRMIKKSLDQRLGQCFPAKREFENSIGFNQSSRIHIVCVHRYIIESPGMHSKAQVVEPY